MKRFSLYLVGFCMSVFLMTSCIKGSNVWEGLVIGVLDYNKSYTALVLKTSSGDLYSPSFSTLMSEGSMNVDGCYVAYCRMDSDLPENSASIVELNGYQTVSLLDFDVIPKTYISDFLTDTANVLIDEVPLLTAIESSDYVSNYLFLVQKVTIPEDWELTWNLSYDYNSRPTIENNQRYYDLFIRASVRQDSDKTLKVDRSFLNAYYVGNYFTWAATTEQSNLGNSYSASSSKFIVRYNYVTSINEGTGEITWKIDQQEYYISWFLPTSLY